MRGVSEISGTRLFSFGGILTERADSGGWCREKIPDEGWEFRALARRRGIQRWHLVSGRVRAGQKILRVPRHGQPELILRTLLRQVALWPAESRVRRTKSSGNAVIVFLFVLDSVYSSSHSFIMTAPPDAVPPHSLLIGLLQGNPPMER